ncbi:MAG: hypothetical protein ACRDKV_06250 [Solirubrobacterales bacterium]
MAALGALFLLWIVAVSAGNPGASRQTAELTFGKKKPGVGTGLFVNIDYMNPDDPGAKPPAVRRVVERLAKGARLDTSVPDACTASDAELMALGEPACPAASKVGEGVVTVDSGLPGPARFVTADVDFFNNTNQLIYLNTVRGTAARTVIRASVSSDAVTTDVALLPGTPPDGAAIDTVHAHFPPLVRDGQAYATTPPRCPRSRLWVNRVSFTYADGVQQSVDSPTPCKKRVATRKHVSLGG